MCDREEVHPSHIMNQAAAQWLRGMRVSFGVPADAPH